MIASWKKKLKNVIPTFEVIHSTRALGVKKSVAIYHFWAINTERKQLNKNSFGDLCVGVCVCECESKPHWDYIDQEISFSPLISLVGLNAMRHWWLLNWNAKSIFTIEKRTVNNAMYHKFHKKN